MHKHVKPQQAVRCVPDMLEDINTHREQNSFENSFEFIFTCLDFPPPDGFDRSAQTSCQEQQARLPITFTLDPSQVFSPRRTPSCRRL